MILGCEQKWLVALKIFKKYSVPPDDNRMQEYQQCHHDQGATPKYCQFVHLRVNLRICNQSSIATLL